MQAIRCRKRDDAVGSLEHVMWMLYLDNFDCNVESSNMRL